MKERANCAEGKFYSDSRAEVVKLLEHERRVEQPHISYRLKDKQLIGGVVPHAGHIFCAREAVHFFDIVKESAMPVDTVVVICPNHTGMGLPVSVDGNDTWHTSLGSISIDREMAQLLKLPVGDEAQKFEHSAEVILPYIQYFLGDRMKLLPVNMLSQSYHTALEVATAIHNAAQMLHRRILVVASSDFTHYKHPQVGYELDSYALEAMQEFDIKEFESRVRSKHISICGFGPIMALMHYALITAGDKARLQVLCRGHSGEVYPSDEVVDYVSILVYSD